MKKYNVTVNGVTYEVFVEEAGTVSAPVQPAMPSASVPAQTPAPTLTPTTAAPTPVAAPAPATSGAQGATKVCAPMPGTILKINVKVGDTVAANQLVCVLEAMKMENEILAEKGGTVKTVEVIQGASVNAGDVIITLE